MSRSRTALLPLLALSTACGDGAPVAPDGRGSGSELVVRLLDVGLGDAVYITNGSSRVFVDGGPDLDRLGRYLDELGVVDTVIDAVILSHVHYDHHGGLRALFESHRGLEVRRFFENKDVFDSGTLGELRDSVEAREARGELVYRDSDDPCGDGSPLCTLHLDGGAKLHVLRPDPHGSQPNDRSTVVKIVGPDSSSFTMWLAGDAEHEEIAWFEGDASYHVSPGMRVRVLKANHHGDCDGVTSRYLERTAPEVVAISLGPVDRLGYVHTETKDLLRARGIPWYRTDANGTLTFRSPGTPGGGYAVAWEGGRASMDGVEDRVSGKEVCEGL